MQLHWLLLCSFLTYTWAQQSFANTKFDLSADLPVEEVPSFAFGQDEKPKQVLNEKKTHKTPKQPHKPPAEQVPTPAPAPVTPTPVQPPSTLAPFTMQTLPTFTFPTMTMPSFPTMAPFTFTTPAPIVLPPTQTVFPQPPQQQVLPQTPQQPPYVPQQQIQVPPAPLTSPGISVQVQPSQVAPSQPAVFQPVLPAPIPQPQSTIIHQTGIPLHGTRQIELVPANQYKDKAELWFKDDFSSGDCASNPDYVAEQFLQKFPRKLLKNNKEVVLARLLSSRLRDCHEKQTKNTWNIMNANIDGLNLSTSEENECRSGLIQEQISCLNVQSFSCQFIQKNYNFRLVPTRIIIQEARLAEDGADKCKKVKKLLKKQRII